MKYRPENLDPHGITDEEMDIFDAIDSSNVADEFVADEVVVHGLLRDRALRDAERDEQRIRDVMSEIESLEQSQSDVLQPGCAAVQRALSGNEHRQSKISKSRHCVTGSGLGSSSSVDVHVRKARPGISSHGVIGEDD